MRTGSAAMGSPSSKLRRAPSAELVEGLITALQRIEREHHLGPARTSFEGFKTVRINNLLTYDELFWEVPLHDSVLPVVERVLDKECLLSSFCSLVLGPGQQAQPIHEDTQLIPLPRPHIPITLNAIWALSDFQQDNLQLGIPQEIAKRFPRRLQELCGYSVYKGQFGHIDNHDPIELLGRERGKRMVWEATDARRAKAK